MWPAIKQLVAPDQFGAYVKNLVIDNFSEETSTPQFVVLHNTGAPTLAQWKLSSSTQRVKNLEVYYKGLGWSGGPHLFIAPEGIWLFNDLRFRGVHSPSWNNVSWGVEIAGDYDKETFEDPVKQNVILALCVLHTKLKLDLTMLKFHKEDPKTTHKGCPGKNVIKEQIVSEVAKLMLKGIMQWE